MQERIRRLASRLTDYWRWWRLALAAATVALVWLAVVVDHALLQALFVLLGFAPLLALMGLGGSRTDSHHEQLAALRRSLAEADDAARRLAQDNAGRFELESQLAARAAVDSRTLPGPGDLTLVIVADNDVESLDTVLRGLAAALPASTECVVLDRTSTGAVGRLVCDVMGQWSGLGLVAAPTNADDHADADVVAAVASAGGRYVLVVDAGLHAGDIATLMSLCRHVPAGTEPWVGAVLAPGRPDLSLLRASACRELGGWPGWGRAADFLERLSDAGHVVAVAGERLQHGTQRLHRLDRRRLSCENERHELFRAVALMPQAEYHTVELLALARELTSSGRAVGFLAHDRWWEGFRHVMHRAPVDTYSQPATGAWVAGLSALLTMNDWARDERELVAAAKSYGVPTLAKIEGVQDFHDIDTGRERTPYQQVDHVLCQGANDALVVESFGGNAHVVGSTRLESAWLGPARATPATPLVVINSNFTWNVLEDARDEFLRTSMEACRSAGLEFVVSMHPSDRSQPDMPIATAPMHELLGRTSMLISRFSTVPFEAMALGVPFVYHNPHGEKVATFTEPDGAFDVTHGSVDLASALIEAMSWTSSYRLRCEAFFRRQVDIDQAMPSAQRSAQAIATIVDG